MATTSNTYTGDGSTTNYSFTFEYLEQSEVKVTLNGVASTAFTFANATTLSFTSAPANGVEVRIYRDTNVDTLKATFFPGSAIKAEDLNNNFTQNNFAVQELFARVWDTDTETIKSNETWVSNDLQVSTTAAQDSRFPALVQTATPTGTNYPTGKMWLQNDSDKTLSVWNGSAWLAVTSGGTFSNQPKVVYVDATAGDDNADGHRISTPKQTIKAAIQQINNDATYGDGSIVVVAPGVYQEACPIDIEKANVSIIGTSLRSCIVHPTVATEESVMFRVNSGSYIQNLTFTGMKASGSLGNTVDADLPVNQGWNVAFYPNAVIKKSPYIQNCTNFSDSEIDNSNINVITPAGGLAGDTDSAPTGGGLLVDGSAVASNSPLRSMVCDSYTHVGLNRPGILVTNNGYCQATSSYAFFNRYHIKTLNGGQANLAASTSDFGDQSLVADGKSTTNIFTANCVTQANVNDTTIRVSNGVADASWHGTSTRPATNMLVSVNSNAQIYPITNVVPQDQATYNANPSGYTGDWIVTISRPNPTKRSENLGFSAQVNTGTNNVQFWLRSMIASSGHTMEYVGSGTDYRALPENGGVPDETKQITELNNGKVWTAITDHNGKFKIGGNQTDDPFFQVDQQLGLVTIPEGSIAFNLLSDTTPQLGGNLDALTNKITNLGTPTANTDAATKAYVDSTAGSTVVVNDTTPELGGELDALNNKIVNLGTPTAAGDATTKAYVDAKDQIIEGDTSAEVVDTGSDGHFKVTTENTERIRVGPAGQIGIAGANYGTSGQLLTSGGPSGAVTWSNPPAGAGSFNATVSGVNLSDGDPVILNSNGTVSKIVQSGADAPSLVGTAQTVVSPNHQFPTEWSPTSFEVPDTNYAVVPFDKVDSSATRYVYLQVLNFTNNSTLSTTSGLFFNGQSTGGVSRYTRAAYDPDKNLGVIVWRGNSTNTTGGIARVFSINKTAGSISVSGSTEYIFESNMVQDLDIVFDKSSGHFIVGATLPNNATALYAYSLKVDSLTSINKVDEITVQGSAYNRGMCYDEFAEKTFICWTHTYNTCRITAITCGNDGSLSKVSATDISTNTSITLRGAHLTYDPFNRKTILTMKEPRTANLNQLTSSFVSINSSTGLVYLGTGTVIDSGTTSDYISSKVDVQQKRLVVAYQGYNAAITAQEGYYITVNTIGGTLTPGTRATISGQANEYFNVARNTLNKRMVLSYTDPGSSDSGKCRILQTNTFTSNLTDAKHYLGISNGAYLNGATATVQIEGSVDDAQTGLTIYEPHYVQRDGSLTTNPDPIVEVFAGTALGATKLKVNT